MAAFTSKASGAWETEGQSTWNEAGHPAGSDTVSIATGHAITTGATWSCSTLTIVGTGSLITAHAGTATVILLSGAGTLQTGAGALTCTSITTTAAAAGVVTIGAGGATMAGVLNNAGTGLLTVSGAVTGVTNLVMGNCTITAAGSISASGTVTGPTAAQTLTVTGGAWKIFRPVSMPMSWA